MDPYALLQASQAISKETELSSLLATVVNVVLQNTHAQTVMVLIEEEGRWIVGAQGSAGQDKPQTLPAPNNGATLPVPLEVIERVIHSRERVIAAKPNQQEAGQEAILSAAAPFFLIQPLAAADKLQGLLYLELSAPLSPECLDGVAVLAAQIAVSLVNAKLIRQAKQAISDQKSVEKILKASEDRYRRLIEVSFDSITIHVNSIYVYINPSGARLLGYENPADLIGRSIYEFIHPDDLEAADSRIRRTQKDGYEVSLIEQKILRRDGSAVDIEVAAVPTTYEGQPAIQAIIRDISHRKQKEEQLKVSEAKFRTLAETMAAAVFIFQDDKNCYVNQYTELLTGYSQAELLSMNFWDVIHPDYQEMVKSRGQARQKGEFVEDAYELKLLAKDGTERWIETKVTVIEFEGKPAVLGTSFDITQRKQAEAEREQLLQAKDALYKEARQELAERKLAEAALLRSNQRLLALQNAGATLAFSRESQFVLDTVAIEMANLLDVQGCIIYDWNHQAGMITAAASYDLLPAGLLSDEAQPVKNVPIIQQVLTSRRAKQLYFNQDNLTEQDLNYINAAEAKTLLVLGMEYQDHLLGAVVAVEKKTTRRFSREEIALAQFLANQAASALQNARLYEKAQQEITERQQAEKALQESEANLSAIFDNSLQAFILLDRDCTVRAINKSARYGLQLLSGQIVAPGDNFLDVVSDEDMATICHNFDRSLRGESTQHEYKITLRKSDYWIECHYDPVLNDKGKVVGICFSTVDISDRKKKAEALAASEARLWQEVHTLLENTQTLVNRSNEGDLLDSIVHRAKKLMTARGAVILLLDEETQELVKITPEIVPLTPANSQQLSNPGGLIEASLSKRQLQISSLIYDERSTRSIQELLNLPRYCTFVCAPLITRGKKLGVLLLWRDKDFEEHDLHMITAFASQAALGIENAHLYRFNQQLAIQQERQRVARGLHDSVTQSIYSIGLAAETALSFLGDDSDARTRDPIEYIWTLSKTGLTEMREQLYRLHPAPLREKDLVSALAEHCKNLSQQYDLQIDFHAALAVPLTPDQQDELYYIARETLWNVIKHAHATWVEIALTQENTDILLSVKDNGIGFDLAVLDRTETWGLKSIIGRAESLKGTVIPESEPGHGTVITVRIPAEVNQPEIQTNF